MKIFLYCDKNWTNYNIIRSILRNLNGDEDSVIHIYGKMYAILNKMRTVCPRVVEGGININRKISFRNYKNIDNVLTNVKPDYTILFTNHIEYNNGISNCIGLCIEHEAKYCIYSEYNNKFFLIKDKFEELIDDPTNIFDAMDTMNNLVKFSKIFGPELHTPGSHEINFQNDKSLSECVKRLSDKQKACEKAKKQSIIIEDTANTSYEIACSSKQINNLKYHEYKKSTKKSKIVEESSSKTIPKIKHNTLLHRFINGGKS